jgi:hypothetical protein
MSAFPVDALECLFEQKKYPRTTGDMLAMPTGLYCVKSVPASLASLFDDIAELLFELVQSVSRQESLAARLILGSLRRGPPDLNTKRGVAYFCAKRAFASSCAHHILPRVVIEFSSC